MEDFNLSLNIPYSEKPRQVIIGPGFAGLNLLMGIKNQVKESICHKFTNKNWS